MAPPRVVIVDDHAAYRAVARRLLEADGYDVVGEAGDGEDAIAAVVSTRADLVLLDVHLPGLDGFGVARRLAELDFPPTVLLISSRPITDLRRQVERSPVAGFLAKDELSGAALEEILG